MQIRPPTGPCEIVATTDSPAAPSCDAVEAALVTAAGPSRQSSGERGRSWNSSEFEVERRTMPVIMANRPTHDDVIDMPAAGSPRPDATRRTTRERRRPDPAQLPAARPQTRLEWPGSLGRPPMNQPCRRRGPSLRLPEHPRPQEG